MSAQSSASHALAQAVTAMQTRDVDATWRALTNLIDTDWLGADSLVVSCFYVATHREWPGGPTGNQLTGFVRFLEERYDNVVAVPTFVTEAVISSVFTADYEIFSFVPRDTLLTLQLLVIAAITAHRGVRGDALEAFIDSVLGQVRRESRSS